MNLPDISIIIISYNTKQILKNCLDSIFENTRKISFELIVVDNASTDGTVGFLKELAKNKTSLNLILNTSNLGFAKANNQAIKLAKGKRVLLLNSDTIINEGVIGQLTDQSMKFNDEAILAPRLLNTDGSVQPSCYHFPTITGAILEFWLGKVSQFSKYYPKGEQPLEVDAAVGAVLLIPREVIDKVGYLNEKYFMYFEDLDYCRRARLKNIKVVYLPSIEIVHLHGESGKNLKEKPNQWLTESSKKYHGIIKYQLITAIIKISSKFKT